MYSATKLPKSVSDINAVYLIFYGDSQLVKIFAESKPMTNDYYGSAARNRVSEIANVVEKKYSIKPQKITHTDKYYSGDDYAYGINNEKNHYFVVYEGTDITIGLKITSPGYGDLAYTIEYEMQPDWGEFLDRIKEEDSIVF